jgi:myosin heavy subunit
MRSRLLLAAAMLFSCTAWAAADTDALAREMNIMREILRTASEAHDDRSVQIRSLDAHYLANQGVLFRASLRDHRVRLWRSGDAEAWRSYLPEFVQDIVVDVNPMPGVDSEELEALRELREEQRDLRDDQRNTRRELRELSRKRDTAAARDEDAEDVEREIAELEAELEVLEKQYDQLAAAIELEHKRFREEREDRYKQRRLDREQAYAELENLLLQTLCDYGHTLKSLPGDEHVNLLIENARRENGNEFDRMFVFQKKDVLACQAQSMDVAELRERATIYDQ